MRQEPTMIMDLATEQQTCIQGRCQHMFVLRACRPGLYYGQQTVLECCPQYSKKSNIHENIWPRAYPDDIPHLPFFMLEVDREGILKRQKEYLEAHVTRILNLEESNKEILVPHPGKTKSTCFVCKTQYPDYRKHVNTKKHRKKLQSSKMECHIKDLVEIVSKSNQIQFKEEASTSCNEESIRSAPPKKGKPCRQPLKRVLKEMKTLQKAKMFSFDEEEEVVNIEIKINGQGLPCCESRNDLHNLVSLHSFRVSEYLM